VFLGTQPFVFLCVQAQRLMMMAHILLSDDDEDMPKAQLLFWNSFCVCVGAQSCGHLTFSAWPNPFLCCVQTKSFVLLTFAENLVRIAEIINQNQNPVNPSE
jgi:hypothetical protein